MVDEAPEQFDSIRAAARLGRSARFQRILIVVGGIVWSAAIGSAGWIGGKLEAKADIAALTRAVKSLKGEVAGLKSQQADTVKAFTALLAPRVGNEPAGRLAAVEADVSYTHRDYVRVTAAAFAGETAARRKAKTKAADDFGNAYDLQIKRGVAPAAAAEAVLAKVAIP